MKRDETFYQALLTRDPRFDGKFFVGVKTTGIYCRPICPAKPKQENVEFFPDHWAAEQAGYRPCLRCRPESAPLSPAWIGKSALVQRALRVLTSQDPLQMNENEFASRFGVSARHLRRLFQQEIGKSPKQIAFENRLNLARKLITETPLSISEIALASGFRSLRRFHSSFQDRFHKKPTDFRRQTEKSPQILTLTVPYRPPFDFSGLLQSYQSHQMGNLEWFEDQKMYRVLTIGKDSGIVAVSDDPKNSCLVVEIDFPNTSSIHQIISRVRSVFDLDSDPVLLAKSLEADPKIIKILKKNPGIRLPSGWEPFEIAIATILGQLVSVKQGRALVTNLIEILGSDSGLVRNGKSIKLFPTPLQIASGDLRSLKTTGRRKETLVAFSNAILNRSVSLEPTQDVDQFLKTVRSIPGIGPWTAQYMALKVLRHTDAFPASDLILARALAYHSAETLEKMSPWRGYVAALFWREYSEILKKKTSRERIRK